MNRPLKILLLDTGNEWGGGTNSMIELVKRLDRTRFSVTCCFYRDYRRGESGRLLSEELHLLDIPLIVQPVARQPFGIKLLKELVRGLLIPLPGFRKRAIRAIDTHWRIAPRARALCKLLKDGGYDLLYVNNQPSTNIEGYLAAEKMGLPVVQHCRIKPTLFPEHIQLINRVVRRVICVSESIADALREGGIDPARLSIVYNAIDTQQALPLPVEVELPAGQPVIGAACRLTGIKCVDHLIMAVCRLKAAGLPVTCLILGEGELRTALEAHAAELGVADQIRFVGFQQNPLAWVQRMDVCVLNSIHEGLPRIALEAMLASKPVVGSDVCGTRDIVEDGTTGLLYPHGDIDALTAAIRRLLTDAGLRQRFGEAGRARVLAEFSIEHYVAGVSAVLAEATA